MVGAALAVLLAVALAIGLAQSSQPRRPAASSQQLTESELYPGVCLTGSDMGLGTDSAWPNTVTAVPCTQRHLAEVVFAANLWPASLATYPGDDAITIAVDNRCQSALDAYTQESGPAVNYDVMGPYGSDDWASGDREVVCIAWVPGLAPLYHSVKRSHK